MVTRARADEMPSEPTPTISASRAIYLDFSSSLISGCFGRLLDCLDLFPFGFLPLVFLRFRGDEDFLVPGFLPVELGLAIGFGHILCFFSSAAAMAGGAMATFRLFRQEAGRPVLLLSIMTIVDECDEAFVGKISLRILRMIPDAWQAVGEEKIRRIASGDALSKQAGSLLATTFQPRKYEATARITDE